MTLPDMVMEALRLSPADKVAFVIDDTTPAIVKIKKVKSVYELAGSLKSTIKLDLDKIDGIIGDAIVDDYLKGLKDE